MRNHNEDSWGWDLEQRKKKNRSRVADVSDGARRQTRKSCGDIATVKSGELLNGMGDARAGIDVRGC